MLSSNWLQFNQKTQTVYGIATYPYYNGATNHTYAIRAKDTEGLYADASLNVAVEFESFLAVSHRFTMRILTDLNLFTRQLDHLVWFVGNVTSYYHSPMSSITLLNVTGPRLTIIFTNNTIVSPYTCPYDDIYSLFQSMTSVEPTLVESLTQYFITALELELVGICEGFTTTSSTVPTSSSSLTSFTVTQNITSPTIAATRPEGSTEPLGRGRVAAIVIPIIVLLLLLLVILVVIMVIRRRKRFQGRSKLDRSDPFTLRTPVMIEDEDEEAAEVPYNELYAAEGIYINDSFYPEASPDLNRAPPPRYVIPPPFPADKTKSIGVI